MMFAPPVFQNIPGGAHIISLYYSILNISYYNPSINEYDGAVIERVTPPDD
jgi:hypothetical protein